MTGRLLYQEEIERHMPRSIRVWLRPTRMQPNVIRYCGLPPNDVAVRDLELTIEDARAVVEAYGRAVQEARQKAIREVAERRIRDQPYYRGTGRRS